MIWYNHTLQISHSILHLFVPDIYEFIYCPPTSPLRLLPLRFVQLSQSPCRPQLYGLSKDTAYLIDYPLMPTLITFVRFRCNNFSITKFSSIWNNFGLSTILGLKSKGTFFICSVLIMRGSGNFRFRVKKGLFGFFNCYTVKVLSKEVTGGNLSTDLFVSFAVQQAIRILRSSSNKF